MKNNLIDKIGETNISNEGCTMKIIALGECDRRVIIEFQDEYKAIKQVDYRNFLAGKVKNRYYKSVCGVACIGNTTMRVNKKKKSSYTKWERMIRRCYDEKDIARNPTYKDKFVCDRWLCYEYFEQDYKILMSEHNFPDKMNLALDKDIINKNNKIYSLDSCILVPQLINNIIENLNKKANSVKDLPIGVNRTASKKYRASMKKQGIIYELGEFDTVEKAFNVYKKAKNIYIKEVLEEYVKQGYINRDSRLYNALSNYKIEIDN